MEMIAVMTLAAAALLIGLTLAANAISFPTEANSNLQASTRELWIRTIKSQVFMKMPLLARLLLSRRVSWKGGKFITRPVDKAEMDDQAQAYLPSEPLTTGRKTMLETPYANWKYLQVPVVYDVEEELQNDGGEPEVFDLTQFLVKKAQRATRIKLYRMMYDEVALDSGGDPDLQDDAATAYTFDNGRNFCGIRQALCHDHTYMHVTRTTSTVNKWWQGASIGENYTDHDTARTASINTFRLAVSAAQRYEVTSPGDYLCIVGPTIFLALKSELESRHIYQRDGSPLAKYGFNTMMIDGIEVVEDPWLTSTFYLEGTSTTLAAEKWMFLLNVQDWELRLHPKRAFAFTGFNWQGDRANGYDEWLARVMLAGNFCCWRPNGSIYLNNVS